MTMRVFFLGDAHLIDADTPAYADLLFFLERMADARRRGDRGSLFYADRFFLLGDFFDFWFAKGKKIYPPFAPMVNSLQTLKKMGVDIHLCEGNHDFFLADYFSGSLAMDVHPDWANIDLGGRKVLISHGDSVNINDNAYRLLRLLLRSRFFYWLQKMMPLALLFAASRFFSRASREKGRDRTEELLVLMHDFGAGKLRDGWDAVIMGHCHRPRKRDYVMDGRPKVTVTVGGWNIHRSFLSYDEGRFALKVLRQGEIADLPADEEFISKKL